MCRGNLPPTYRMKRKAKAMISFTVYGKPITQGSKIAHALYDAEGNPRLNEHGRVIIITREMCKGLDKWRRKVAAAAREVYDGEPMAGEFQLFMTFALPRPKSHYGTGRNSRKLKASAPPRPITQPDTIKMARAVEDALTKIIYNNDGQVNHHRLWKVFVDNWEEPYAAVDVSPVTE